MSCYTIYYKDGAKWMRPVRSEAEYRALRDSERNRAADKRHMVQMNYSCLPGKPLSPALSPEEGEGVVSSVDEKIDKELIEGCGPLKGATRPSNSVGMDIDILRNENEDENEYQARLAAIPELIMAKKEDLGLLMLERSATKGYHVVFRRWAGMSQEENLRWASELLGVKYDEGAKDITRVFFTPADKLLFVSAELFEQEGAGGEAGSKPWADDQGTVTVQESSKGSAQHDKPLPSPLKGDGGSPSYLGIPYSTYIAKWWELYNDGREPMQSNRNTLTFELAVNMRHIMGFDRELMARVIPCYDGFDPQEKMQCIDSALAEKRTQMPKRLKDVLNAVRADQMKTAVSSTVSRIDMEALDRVLEQDELFHYEKLPRLPLGVRDSVDAAGHPMAMATLVAIAPAIGAVATGVKLDVHGRARGLNLCSFVVGDSGSGKGQLDEILASWTYEMQAEADAYYQQEEEWAAKTNRMKSGKAPEQPVLPIRMVPLNNTIRNIELRLAHTDGKHAFSFTPEADNVVQAWSGGVNNFSVILRQAYDEARYDREAKSAEAVRVHIKNVRWNTVLCGTQDALYRVITNYTDGLLSRMAIARTPDNTFTPLAENPAQLTDLQREHIMQVAHLLPLMQGEVTLEKLEQRGRDWLENVRLESLKNADAVLARQRMRGCVNAQRLTCALWLPRVAEALIKKHGLNGAERRLKQEPGLWAEMLRKMQGEEMLTLFDTLAEYLISNDLHFFRTRLEKAYGAHNYATDMSNVRGRRGKNDTIYGRLADDFTFEQAMQQALAVKGHEVTRNSVHQMLKNWRNQSLITVTEQGTFKKVATATLS